MDRLAALFEQLSLPEISRLLRRTVLAGLAVGVVALGLSLFLSHPFVGLGACLGIGIGLLNIRLVTSSVVKVNERQPSHPKRILASQTLARLMGTTVVVIGLMVASVQLGLATAAGVAVFYFLLLANLLQMLLKQGVADFGSDAPGGAASTGSAPTSSGAGSRGAGA